jgi:hypothetical protein
MEDSMQASRAAVDAVPAVTGLLDLFASSALVALGEMHGLQEEADFVAALLHHPAFPTTVQVMVVEYGNARYQGIVDRFVAGEPIAAADLRPVWRDIFGLGFDAPIYEQFFRTVRAINRTLPPGQRLRVLLGDPPVDWSQVAQKEDLIPWLSQRDAHFAEVVETQVCARGYRALLIAGGMHFVRDWPLVLPTEGDNVVQRLERSRPGRVHVILPHYGFGRQTSVLEATLAECPIPSLISLQTTWLGELDARLLQEDLIFHPNPDLPPPPPLKQGVTLGSAADSYLYLGPRSSLTRSTINPAIYRGDEPYMSEIQRRFWVIGIPLKVENLLPEGDPRFFTD